MYLDRVFRISLGAFAVIAPVLCPRVPACLSRNQGDGAGTILGALAHAGPGGHALAAGAETP